MQGDLRRLIDDPRFRTYHRERRNQNVFNTFDVLRYSDYEIRHSNVLAWLLRPADTHGIDARFLKWFVAEVDKRLLASNTDRLPELVLEVPNVDVWRERDFVDITLLFRKERCLIAIENKAGPALPDHVDQVSAYERKLREKHEGYAVTSVLLTTSSDGSVDFPGIAHVGWEAVKGAIRSLLDDGAFHAGGAEAFVRQYVDLVERWFRPSQTEGFRHLVDSHHSVLRTMRKVLDEDGDSAVRGHVLPDMADYCDSIVMLVKQSRQNPMALRRAVADCLERRGCKLHYTHNAKQRVYWLNWSTADLADVARQLGCGGFFLSWGMTFAHDQVRVSFHLYQTAPEEQGLLDRFMDFMRATPINRHNPAEYPLSKSGYGWYKIYEHEILSRDELFGMAGSEVEDAVIQWLVDFMGSDDSECRRIEDYFRCLAFRSDEPAPPRTDSP